jgi:uncharacterized protein YdhG (YjbR/CyaY superfamily)
MTTDAWIAAQPEPQRTGLAAACSAVRSLLPAATEATAYGLPAWQVDGTSVAGLACAKAHWSFVPFSGALTDALADRLSAYELTKGSIKVPADARLPKTLIATVIRARLAEISMAPDSKGIARDFHANGALKARGRMKDGELHGAWAWWRADGTLLRTGSFDRGRQVGEWTTYDAAGKPARTTDKGR